MLALIRFICFNSGTTPGDTLSVNQKMRRITIYELGDTTRVATIREATIKVAANAAVGAASLNLWKTSAFILNAPNTKKSTLMDLAGLKPRRFQCKYLFMYQICFSISWVFLNIYIMVFAVKIEIRFFIKFWEYCAVRTIIRSLQMGCFGWYLYIVQCTNGLFWLISLYCTMYNVQMGCFGWYLYIVQCTMYKWAVLVDIFILYNVQMGCFGWYLYIVQCTYYIHS